MVSLDLEKKGLGKEWVRPEVCPVCSALMSVKGWESVDAKEMMCRACGGRFPIGSNTKVKDSSTIQLEEFLTPFLDERYADDEDYKDFIVAGIQSIVGYF